MTPEDADRLYHQVQQMNFEQLRWEKREMTIPKVVLVMKPVDGGRAMIGLIECPHCGQEHFTTQLECGERQVFCGTKGKTADGWNRVFITRIA